MQVFLLMTVLLDSRYLTTFHIKLPPSPSYNTRGGSSYGKAQLASLCEITSLVRKQRNTLPVATVLFCNDYYTQRMDFSICHVHLRTSTTGNLTPPPTPSRRQVQSTDKTTRSAFRTRETIVRRFGKKCLFFFLFLSR